ncbi:uncharacterized protein LOC115753179 [Rhodamnia argentea]|uniref:Uncharacterized protein LOC115753179 n=1 Tax=Rhodamnia argentea TaxID=178133 RepID=A0ABM3HJY3_9MYRT|nr:uncharacterized protein LOC115753179 [Rhodamnia argentea]
MKNKVSVFLKHIFSVLAPIAKAKSAAIKSKTSAAKGRLVLFSMMNSRKVLFGSISDKIHSLLGHGDEDEDDGDCVADQSGAVVPYEANASESRPSTSGTSLYGGYNDEGDDKYPDLRHSLFDGEEDDDEADPGGSVIDLVKNSKDAGDEVCLEDETDHAADLFIRRFHKQMRLQKLESFKRLQEMLGRSV